MYLLYVDESDTTDDEPAAARFYCVCGVRVAATSYGATIDRLSKLVEGWKPVLPANFEIKGADLFHGEGVWRGRDVEERVSFARSLTRVLAASNVKFFLALKSSEDFTADYRALLPLVLREAAKVVAATGTRTGKQMMLVFDQRPDFSVVHSQQLRETREAIVAAHAKSCRFIDHGYEADSKHAPLVQAADFVAFHIRRQRMLSREPSLLAEADDPRVVDLLDEMVEVLRPKTVYVTKR